MKRLLLPLSLLVAPAALALPQFDRDYGSSAGGTCQTKGSKEAWDRHGKYIQDVVHVYLSDTFGADWELENGGSAMSEEEAKQLLLSSMEVWNRESRGPVFVYGGRVEARLDDFKTLDDMTCSELWTDAHPDGALSFPALLVSADPTTDIGSSGNPELGSVAALYDENGTRCSNGLTPIAALIMGDDDDQALRPTLIHELGHGLGLGHSFTEYTGGSDHPDAPMSVMHYKDDGYNDDVADDLQHRLEWRAHLWPWDTDCVDDDLDASWDSSSQDQRQRSLAYRWRTYRPHRNDWSTWDEDGWRTTNKTATTAGYLAASTASDERYPLIWSGGRRRISSAYGVDAQSGSSADRSLDLTDRSDTLSTTQAHNFVSPLLYSHLEWSAPRYRMLSDVSWTAYEPDHTDVGDYDPPRWGRFTSGTDTTRTDLRYCRSSLGCRSSSGGLLTHRTSLVQSHASLRATYDPVRDDTLFASVLTRDCNIHSRAWSGHDGFDADSCGRIRVYPGSVSGYDSTVWARPDALTAADVTLPSYSGFSPAGKKIRYTATTHVAPAIACADGASWSRGLSHAGNCIVAWVDAGTPDNDILVAHFRYTGSAIIWYGSAQVVSAQVTPHDADGVSVGSTMGIYRARSASDLSAAYIDGRFMIAFKSAISGFENHPAVAMTDHHDLDDWEHLRVFDEDETIEAPSFVHDPDDDQREAALVWTVLD